MSVHAVLKAETRHLHAQLEANPTNAALMTIDLSMGVYERLLVRYFGFYEALELRLGACDLAFVRKAGWLGADLVQLGYTAAALERLPRPTQLPALGSVAAGMGSLYVLEGATLGGQIITRHLHKTLPHAPTRFFGGYGDETGTRWKRFLTRLEGCAPDIPALLSGARGTYRCFDAWLSA